MLVPLLDILMMVAAHAAAAQAPVLDPNRVPRPPRPAGSAAEFFGNNSYPPDAVRARQEGRVLVEVAVNAAGRATGCTVKTSATASLDEQTCAIALQRVRFEPGRDAKNRPVAGLAPLSVNWKLDGPPPIAVDSGPIEFQRSMLQFDVDAGGKPIACRVLDATGKQTDVCPADFLKGTMGVATVAGKPVPSRVTVTNVSTVTAREP